MAQIASDHLRTPGHSCSSVGLHGELEAGDAPQVTFVVTEEIVQVPQDNTEATHGDEARPGPQQSEGGNGGGESNQTEIVVPGPADGEVDEQVDADLVDLGSIMESVMGRQWFQLFVNREVDDLMVRKRWGVKVLEVFQINRDMMELQQQERRLERDELDGGALHVRPMSEDEDSLASSGPKVFPGREVVAGGRGEGSLECEGEPLARTFADEAGEMAESEKQQMEATAVGNARGRASWRSSRRRDGRKCGGNLAASAGEHPAGRDGHCGCCRRRRRRVVDNGNCFCF